MKWSTLALLLASLIALTLAAQTTINTGNHRIPMAAPALFTCGNTVTAGASTQSGVSGYNFFVPCTLGSNPHGYTLAGMTAGAGTASGKYYTGIYVDTSSGCFGGATHCPNTQACVDTTGTTVTTGLTIITALPVSCPTFSANESIWFGFNADNGTVQILNQTSACPPPVAFIASSSYQNQSASPSWTSPAGTSVPSTACYVLFASFNVVP